LKFDVDKAYQLKDGEKIIKIEAGKVILASQGKLRKITIDPTTL
jgi:hypothetical protein